MSKRSPVNLVREPRNTACVMLGDGIGNIIQQTSLLQAVSGWFAEVDVFLPRSPPTAQDLFENLGIANIRRVACQKQAHVLRGRYDAVFATWLVRGHRRRIKAAAYYQSPDPVRKGLPESTAACLCLLDAGWRGATPLPVSGWLPPRCDLPPGPLVGLSTGSLLHRRWLAKRYGRYADVVELVTKERPDVTFVHLGVQTDTTVEHPRVVDLREKISLGEAAGVARQCRAFLGNDTGLVHVSAALRVPTIVVFGPTVIRKNLPPKHAVPISLALFCQPCQTREWFRRPGFKGECQRECLRDLEPRAIAQSVLEFIRE